MNKLKYLINNEYVVFKTFDNKFIYAPYVFSFIPGTYILPEDASGSVDDAPDGVKKATLYLEEISGAVGCKINKDEISDVVFYDAGVYYYEENSQKITIPKYPYRGE